MAKVDFKNLRVQATIEGDPIIVDTRKELGNLVWGAARDIAVSDFGKEIYFSDGPIEVARRPPRRYCRSSTCPAPPRL